MPESTFLELVEGVGVESDFLHKQDKNGLWVPNPKAGQPAPLTHIGVTVPVPTKIEGGDVIQTTRQVGIDPAPHIDPDDPIASRIIPGTRIVETHAAPVVEVLLSTGNYVQVDPPKSDTKARQSAGKEG